LKEAPEYALAYVGLADALATQPHAGFESPGRVWDQAEDSIEGALELNPNLSGTRWVYSQFLAIVGRWDQVLRLCRGGPLDRLGIRGPN
jgi:hypothetical protein